jgi:competence protein ComEA
MKNRLLVFLSLFAFLASSALPALAGTRRVYTGKLNINTASAADLTRLPGVGEVIACRIIKEREELGAFKETRNLKRIKGVSERCYEGFKKYVDIKGENTLHSYMDLNTVTKPLLLGLPGMSEGEARSILNYRKANGSYRDIEDLKSVPGIDGKRFAELKEWLTVAR